MFSAFDPLSPAEAQLLAECAATDRVRFGDGERPAEDSPGRHLRGAFLRALLLTEGSPLSQKGLRLRGAWIDGVLDLQGARCPHDITLAQCHLTDPVRMVNARLAGFYVAGSRLAGLSGDNAVLDGALFLRGGSVVVGEISLAGARITGDLQFCDLELRGDGQDALFAPSLRVEGSVFLGNYPYSEGTTTLESEGAIFLSSLSVGHDVFVTNASITPHPEARGNAFFQASEEHGGNIALSLARARIGGILYLRDNQLARGIVNLAGAEVARLRDEPDGPGASYPIRLDGFRYGDFSRHSDTTLATRLAWLDRRPADTPFTAQPYEHLAKVLTEMGHRGDARAVLLRKEMLLRRENRRTILQRHGRGLRWAWAWIVDAVARWTVGFGYRSARVLGLALVLIVGLGWVFHRTWAAGDMTPNAAPILTSSDWIAATRDHPGNPGAFWSQPGQAGQDWETFNAFAYAADVVIPIVSLGQEAAWAPSTSRSDWGRAAWWLRWFAKAAGWIITALGAAAVTGAVRQE